MIRSFRSRRLRVFFETGDVRRLSVQNPDRVGRILRALDAAESPRHMDIPGLRFHALKGDQKGRFAVTVSGNWRVTFGWRRKDAVEVDMEDYH